jgi:hypothetical protein
MSSNFNIPARCDRVSDTGFVWVEKITNGTGTIAVEKYSPVRIRATAPLTVSLDGVLAATMTTNEILIVNAGIGVTTDVVRTVDVTIAGGAAFVQVARLKEPQPRENIIPE